MPIPLAPSLLEWVTVVFARARDFVRLHQRESAFAVGRQPNQFSVCDADDSPALRAIAEAIAEQLPPACMPACVADSDPSTPDVLEPSCVLTEEAANAEGGLSLTEVPPCGPGDALPDGYDACHVALTGNSLGPRCRDHGFNLEFRIVRRTGVPAPEVGGISATCELSDDKAADRPDLL